MDDEIYYSPAEARPCASRLHWAPGLLLMAVAFLHAWLGRRSRPALHSTRQHRS